MKNPGRIVAHLPARGGSERVPAKNLRLLAGEPMLAYAVKAALASRSLDEVYVNTESDEIVALAEHLGARVYRRRPELATGQVTSDAFNMDIIEALAPDTLAMINPVCPLITADDVDAAVRAYSESDADTLITVSETQLQTFCRGEPVNIDLDGPLTPTQENPPVSVCNWAVSLWDCETFRQNYTRFGYGSFGRKRLFHPLDPLRSVKVSEPSDFRLCERLIQATRSGEAEGPPRFWSAGGRDRGNL